MRVTGWSMLGTALLLLAACTAPPFAPKWNVDLFFPLRYPDGDAKGFRIATGLSLIH
jgi:hypothetical protein